MGFPELLVFLLFLSVATQSTAQIGFKCTQRSKCSALVGYKSPNTTTLFHLNNFFHVKNLNSLLAANDLPSSTPSNYTIKAQQIIKIPIPCACSNGTGFSDGIPIYTVQPNDGLYYIAANVFMGLVTSSQIQEANRIEDPDKINIGQKFTIPLPCSCDDVGGERVVHYAHIVEEGSTVESIAQEFGTTSDVLLNLNGIANNSQLIAETAFDVPLRACNSSVSPPSIDYPLLVPNGTSVFTANSCVKCKCDSANNWKLQCEPSGLGSANSTWSTCPSMLCGDGLSLSNTTTSACSSSTCAYSGFSNQTILTTLDTISTCPANTPPGPDNYASSMGLSWTFLFISLHLIFLWVYPL